jgi:hypothetical protein
MINLLELLRNEDFSLLSTLLPIKLSDNHIFLEFTFTKYINDYIQIIANDK